MCATICSRDIDRDTQTEGERGFRFIQTHAVIVREIRVCHT